MPRPDADAAGDQGFRRRGRSSLAALLVLPPLAAVGLSGIAALGSLLRADVAAGDRDELRHRDPGGADRCSSRLRWPCQPALFGRAGRHTRSRRRCRCPAGLVLAVPPVAVSAGLFVVLRPVADPFALAIPLIILVNALDGASLRAAAGRAAADPLRRALRPARRQPRHLRTGGSGSSTGRCSGGRSRRRFAVATALSLGDLGVAAFFGSGNILTLPLLLYQRMGAYRMAEAASVALLLALLVLALFLAAQRWSGDPLARSR